MIEPRLLTAFPLIPLFAAIIALGAGLVRRDVTNGALRLAIALQIATGIGLSIAGARGAALRLPLAETPLAIVFAFGPDRIPLMLAYLIPLAAAAGRLETLRTPSLRLLLLLYMGGGSGLIVTADLFNFFVFYELMVMAAYMLVGANGRFYASLKYMLFGALGATALLGGIVLLYATGAGFTNRLDPQFLAADPLHQRWTLLLLATAFLLKSALVPAWTWVATCHAATVTPVSALLAGFTLMIGLFGLQTHVLVPAAALGIGELPAWIATLGMATVLIPALFALAEPHPKRCVAVTTVVAGGFVAWLMARGHTDAAMSFIAVHAVGKTLMFHALDEMDIQGRCLRARRRSWAVFVIGTIIAIGLTPTPIGHWKRLLADDAAWAGWFVTCATALALATLFKFRCGWGGRPPPSWLVGAGSTALVATLIVGVALLSPGQWAQKMISDTLAIAVAWILGARLHRTDAAWRPEWRRRPFPHLNAELLGAVLLLASGVAWLILPYTP